MGPAGIAGVKGDQGPIGLTGAKGATGLTGPSGAIGPMGPAGIAGVKGDQGPIGLTGAKGATGLTGPMGAIGPMGSAGIAGVKGDQGPIGLTGAKGATGLTGPMGANGASGAVGPTGPSGAQGPAGLKGDKGDKGDTGDAGLVTLNAGNGILGGTIQGNGGVIAVNIGTAAGQIPVIGSNGRLPASIIEGPKTVYIKDIKPNGTHGGSCDPSNGWEQIRDLNNITGDTSFASISQNQITLAAGTYDFEAHAPAYLDGYHKAVLVNAQTNEFLLLGSNARSHNISGGMEPSKIFGMIKITVPTTFVIKHRCSIILQTIGFGIATSFGVDEVYTQVKITKVK